ncbi:hypothetical protein DBR32_03805 [Taibaiella sp. KBW10]|uniref:ABC transporter ATP-binding protein n=1 Tax=Taibaiella sp. KBW10 TaxID=2153357 RepID=UPI000F5ACCC8|nr:ABC transporter ATP-binding protein [Taibaiella sp. KBW10]RQO31941.1 hypothetical protein DBR32_03805 [Taibaiella sp. KBW10]
MSNIAIKVEDVGKMYRLGQVGTGTISQDLNRWVARIRGKEDPFTKIGETNDRTIKGESNMVWALKDVNFEIQKGDAVGIIGRNGAGKSTLLKLLSKVTKPTTGSIKINDRIASLLEVGTGFHPEMTGRENIYLNGAILGMTKKEIKRKFDEIVDFSGVERYIDTPVKRYSSGMYVRLAFAVAAHLESEILIVDEVLAVGDAEFQKKCLGKMGDVSKGEGRTVLFVSHNMAAVKTLCNKGILMQYGSVAYQGDIAKVIDRYIASTAKPKEEMKYEIDANKKAQILLVDIFNEKNIPTTEFSHLEDIRICLNILNDRGGEGTRINIAVLDQFENVLFISRRKLDKGFNSLEIMLKGNVLIPNRYVLSIAIDNPGVELYDVIDGGIIFDIIDLGNENSINGDTENGIFVAPLIWNA